LSVISCQQSAFPCRSRLKCESNRRGY